MHTKMNAKLAMVVKRLVVTNYFMYYNDETHMYSTKKM